MLDALFLSIITAIVMDTLFNILGYFQRKLFWLILVAIILTAAHYHA
jgi:hypothetical protein